jgi:hypothetical protein
MRERRVKPLSNKYIICTMWNTMNLAAQIRIALRTEREREKKKWRSQITCPYVRVSCA